METIFSNLLKRLKRQNLHKNLSLSSPNKLKNLNRTKTHLLKWDLTTLLIFSTITILTKSHKITLLTSCKRKTRLIPKAYKRNKTNQEIKRKMISFKTFLSFIKNQIKRKLVLNKITKSKIFQIGWILTNLQRKLPKVKNSKNKVWKLTLRY